MSHKVKFSSGEIIEVEEDSNLSEVIDITDAPLLFGCRTGICGTCLVNIKEGSCHITPPSQDEQEFLEIAAENVKEPRLACQFHIKGDIELEPIGK